VGEDVPERAPLLASRPAVEEAADRVVELEEALFPELEYGDGGERLARRVPQHHVVGPERSSGDLSDRHVQQGLCTDGHVALRAVVEIVDALLLEELDHPLEADRDRSRRGFESRAHTAEA
jgi:hypothetical protein